MRASTTQSVASNAPPKKHLRDARSAPAPPVTVTPVLTNGSAMLQRKAHCACGGGCPGCQEAGLKTVAGEGYHLQRKCACDGGSPCAECEEKNPPVQRFSISQPHDDAEVEADNVAERVMRMTPSGRTGDSSPHPARPLLQRQATKETPTSTPPPIVREVLRSAGQSLSADARAFFEPRLGFDLGDVRVHTDAEAARSAQAVEARAYTVGHHIVFGSGEYAPDTDSGRRLLAHEMAHVIQQGGQPASLQRQCVKSICPPAPISIAALFPVYEAAEKCIQEMYASTHPASKRGVSLSFNADWLHLTGGTPQEKKALDCARGLETPGAGPNVTGKSGMFAAAPDIWDLRNTTMYEITTPSGMTIRVGKLGAELLNANRICGPADCGGLQFDRGTWAPDVGCYSLGGDLYFNAFNNQGVIVYNMLKDATKELALATLLALMAASLKNAGPKAAGAVATKTLGKAVPVYAVASLAAMVVLVASGRAEAKVGPGDEEPLVALFKAMEQKGTPVPKEIQEMLDANPDLKDKMNKAMAEGGDPSKLQEELNKQILDTIAANKDQFTKEELEVLLATTQVAGKSLPKGDMTAEELKKLAANAKSGTGDGGGGTGAGSGPAKDTPSAPPKSEGESTKAGGSKEGADKGTAGQLSQTSRDNLAKAPSQVRGLFNDMLGAGPNAQKLTDADVQRFLSLVPSTLTADQAAKLKARMQEATGLSVEQILDSLKTALTEIDKPDAGKGDAASKDPKQDKLSDADSAANDPAAKPPETATLTTDPTAGPPTSDPQKLIEELTAKAKKTSFKDLTPGVYQVTWTREHKGIDVGTRISGSLRGKLKDGKITYVGRVEAEVTAVAGRSLKLKFITATPMVAADGKIVFTADHFVGREDNVVLDESKKPKPK